MIRPLLAALAIGVLVGFASLVPTTTGEQQNGDGHSRPEAAGGYVAKPRPALPVVAATRKEAHPAGPASSPELVADLHGRAPATLENAMEVPAAVFSGTASWYDAGGLIALPQGPGYRFRVCGRNCRTLVSTDTGPFVAGRIVDLPPDLFSIVCGVPREIGLCPVSLVIEGREP